MELIEPTIKDYREPLQPPILLFRIEARTRFRRIQVMVPHNQRPWKDTLQLT